MHGENRSYVHLDFDIQNSVIHFNCVNSKPSVNLHTGGGLGLAKQLAGACALPSEAIYSALVLLDQCLAAGMRFPRVATPHPPPPILTRFHPLIPI